MGYGDKVWDEKMSVFVDDVVVRLYGTIGDSIDHSDVLETVGFRLESFDVKC